MDIERLEIDANGLTFTARVAGPRRGRPVAPPPRLPPDVVVAGGPSWRPWARPGSGPSPPSSGATPPGPARPRSRSTRWATWSTTCWPSPTPCRWPPFDLVGHDWGGMVAWVVAARHAERVRSLTVVSTPHPEALREARPPATPSSRAPTGSSQLFRQPEQPERMLLGPDGSGAGLRQLFSSAGLDPAVADEYVSTLTQPGALTAALNWYRAMDEQDVAGPAARWSCRPCTSGRPGDGALGRRAAEAHGRAGGRPVPVRGARRGQPLDPRAGARRASRLLLDHLAST